MNASVPASWSMFYESWAWRPTPFPTLLVRYEDLHSNPVREFRRILKFLKDLLGGFALGEQSEYASFLC